MSRGLDDIAGIHQPKADAPGDGRRDIAVNEIHLHAVDQPLVVLHRSFVLFDQRDLGGELLLGNGVLLDERFIARLIDARVVEQGLIADELPFVLRQLGLIRPGIDFGQLVALLHHVALFVKDLHQLAIHASLDGHGIDGRYGAEAGDIYADIAFHRFGGIHRRCRVRALSLCSAGFPASRPGRLGVLFDQ